MFICRQTETIPQLQAEGKNKLVLDLQTMQLHANKYFRECGDEYGIQLCITI